MWSGTQWYKGGKYTSDGHFSPNVVDSQLGCVAMIKALIQMGAIDAKSFGPGTNIGNLGNETFLDGGSGGNSSISQMNPQSVLECTQMVLGLNARAKAQNRNLEVTLNAANYPDLLDLEPQTTFELIGVDKDLAGTYTVEDVLFSFDGSGIRKIGRAHV